MKRYFSDSSGMWSVEEPELLDVGVNGRVRRVGCAIACLRRGSISPNDGFLVVHKLRRNKWNLMNEKSRT